MPRQHYNKVHSLLFIVAIRQNPNTVYHKHSAKILVIYLFPNGNSYFCSDSIYNTVLRFKPEWPDLHMTSWLRVLYHNLNKALHTHIWIKYWINSIGSTWCLPSWCRFFRIRFVRTRRRRRCSRKTRSRRRRCPSRWTRESDEKKNYIISWKWDLNYSFQFDWHF